VIYRRGRSMRVMLYAGRDPLTGKKKWVSRQVRGTGRAALKEAKQIEALQLEGYQQMLGVANTLVGAIEET
jgi:hypothetical protein